jgi:phytoene dehydrogenase-like protein
MTHYDAIVIGTGIGGLAAGLLLSHRGKKTLLLERNKQPGGRLSSFNKDGFQIDLGVHVISRSDKGPIGEVLRRVGIKNPITYTHVRPLSSYQGKTFIFPHDLKKMVPESEFKALMAFLGDIRSMPEEKVNEYDDLDLKAFLCQYTREPFIHACIGNVCSVYLCLPNWLASAGEFMRCLRYETAAKASGYPEGGCSVISNTYSDGIKKLGGEIRFGADVQKIEVAAGRVKGVVVGDDILQADMVVSNADIKNTVLKLVGPDHFSSAYTEYIKNLQYSWGGPVVRVALDQELTDLKMLTQIGTIDQENYYDKLNHGIIPDELNLFIVIPSNFSPAVAPKGKQLICIATPMEPATTRNINDEIVEAALNTVEKYIPGLRKNARWINVMSSSQMDKMLGENGAGIGIGQTAGQCGDKRPSIKTPIDGLYIVGGEAGGTGVGTELCVSSAMEFMDMIE